MENASEKMSEVHSRHLVSKCLEIFEVNWASQISSRTRKDMSHGCEGLQDESYIKYQTYERCQEFYVQAKTILLLEQRETVEASNQGLKVNV